MNFTRAAENLGLSQQALSRYITSLEKELNTQLFIRKNTRNIFLSEEGKIYFNLLQRFESEFEHTRRCMNTVSQTLWFGYNNRWNLSFMIPQILKSCREQQPGLDIRIKCLKVNELVEALCSQELDVALTISDYLEPYPELIQESITSIQRVLLYSELLASPEDIHSPADLYNETFFLQDTPFAHQMLPQIESLFAPYHFSPRFQFVDNLETIQANLENGQGVAMLDEWTSNILSNPQIHSVELNSKIPISLVWRRSSHQAGISTLKNEFRSFFDKQGDA